MPNFPRPHLRIRRQWREVLDTLVFVVVVYALVEISAPRFLIEGRSMLPNFHDGERLIVTRLTYLFGKPSRGDIVIFNAPNARPNDPPLIKRVIGLPGDTVAIRDTRVYVNHTLLDEPYINEPCNPTSCPDDEWLLGADEYFVMGDNRNNSRDSRRFGPIHFNQLIGEAFLRYWPPNGWGIVMDLASANSPSSSP